MPLFKIENRIHKRRQPESVLNFNRIVGKKISNPDTAMTVAAYYRGVTYISTQIAKLPIRIKDNKNAVINNKISSILNLSFNDEYMPSFNAKLFLIQQAIHTGNGYAEIERTIDGRVIGLWPIKTESVQLVRLPSGVLAYRVLDGQINGNGDVYLKPKDMFHLRNFPTKDGYLGQGTLAYAAETMGIGLGANEFSNGLFANGGIPSGIISVEGKLNPDSASRLKEQWDQNHSGRKVGGTAVLEAGAKYTPISLSNDQLQFIETKKLNVEDIARFLGVPPTKLFHTGSLTYNNIEHSNLEVATDTLDAWAKNFEQEIDIKLLNMGYAGQRSELAIYEIFRGDMKSRSEYFVRRMNTGSITPNEIRSLEGEAPYEGGDRYYIATNNYTPQDKLDDVIDSQLKKDNAKRENEETVNNFIKSKIN